MKLLIFSILGAIRTIKRRIKTMVNNNTPVSYECKTNPEPKLLADVNVADMMRATLDVLMITRENANITYKALFGDTRPDPEMSHLNGGSMIEMLDDIHSIARDILQMVVATKNGLGIEESPVLSSSPN
jgi:hypothetical protein